MKPSDFNKPTKHPYGLLDGCKNACEKESWLCWALDQCINAGKWLKFDSNVVNYSLIEDGLLEHTGELQWSLSKKAIGLLYSVYGK
jgi:hypothetical protein